MSGESQQVTESVHGGAQIDSEIKLLVEEHNGSYNIYNKRNCKTVNFQSLIQTNSIIQQLPPVLGHELSDNLVRSKLYCLKK